MTDLRRRYGVVAMESQRRPSPTPRHRGVHLAPSLTHREKPSARWVFFLSHSNKWSRLFSGKFGDSFKA